MGLLRGYYSLLAPLLETVADAPLPQDGEQCASSLHQRAWLLQCHALELHRADAALAHHAESLGGLLAALFSSEPPEAYGQGEQSVLYCTVLYCTALYSVEAPQEGEGGCGGQ